MEEKSQTFTKLSKKIFLLFTLYTLSTWSYSQSKQSSYSEYKINDPIKIIEKKDVEYAYPYWSKDGKQILYQSNESGKWQIYLMDEDGTNTSQITHDTSNNNFVNWSPDNKKIAFVSDRTGNEEIFIMDTNGENQKQLTFNKARDIHPYFTPKGDKLFFNSTRDDTTAFEIYCMNIDGTNVQRITTTPDDETCTHLSPKENKILYLNGSVKRISDIYLMDINTHKVENLTHSDKRVGWPSWFPNGDDIIYSSDEDNTYKLFIYNLKTKQLKKISNPAFPSYDARANVSADGKKIVFNRQVDGTKNTIGIYVLYLK
jgi:TolB protein